MGKWGLFFGIFTKVICGFQEKFNRKFVLTIFFANMFFAERGDEVIVQLQFAKNSKGLIRKQQMAPLFRH